MMALKLMNIRCSRTRIIVLFSCVFFAQLCLIQRQYASLRTKIEKGDNLRKFAISEEDVSGPSEYESFSSKMLYEKKPTPPMPTHREPSVVSTARDVMNRCAALNLTYLNRFECLEMRFKHNIVLIDNKNMAFCEIPKVAHTNFRRLFLYLYGFASNVEMHNISSDALYGPLESKFIHLDNTKHDEAVAIIKAHTKTMFVRDPLRRLVLGFNAKFRRARISEKNFFLAKVQRFYNESSDSFKGIKLLQRNIETNPLTFPEFLQYVSDTHAKNNCSDQHFMPYHVLCNPCELSYDYVGRVENIQDDIAYILKHHDINASLPSLDTWHPTKSIEEIFRSVSTELLRGVWESIKMDYYLFGYRVPLWVQKRLNISETVDIEAYKYR